MEERNSSEYGSRTMEYARERPKQPEDYSRETDIHREALEWTKQIVEQFPEKVEQEQEKLFAGWRAGNLSKKDALDFVTDREETGKLRDETKERLEYLTSKDKLDGPRMTELIEVMREAKEAALYSITFSSISMSERDFKVEGMINDACVEEILSHSPHHPPPGLVFGSEDLKISFAEAARIMVDGVDRHHRNWDNVEVAAYNVAEDARHYNATGEPPKWFNPETMTLSYQEREDGFNLVNHNQLDPAMSREEFAESLVPSWNALVKERNDDGSPGINNLDFTRMALYPMLDRDMAAGLPHFDEPGTNYNGDAGDGTIPEEWNKRYLTEYEVADPMNHMQSSYGKMLVERMHHFGLGDAAGPEDLAQQLAWNVPALKAMEEYAQKVSERAEEGNLTGADGNDSPIQWNDGTAQAWERMMEMTNEGTDTRALMGMVIEMRDRAIDELTKFGSHDDYLEETQYMNRQELRSDPVDGDVHPHSTLLRETFRDLDNTIVMLHDLNWSVNTPEAEKTEPKYSYAELMERFQTGERTDPTGEALARTMSEHENTVKEREYRNSYDQAVDDIPPGHEEAVERLGIVGLALMDRAMRNLAHADFITSNVRMDLAETAQG